jgi:hydrophobe/amphiphile efflux-3 (HAE3) family protein
VSACAQRYAKAFPSLGVPAVNNPTFIQGVLLEPTGQQVRPFWTWALPDTQHALITVRLDRKASLDQVRHIVDIVNNAASSSDLKELHDLRFVASGSPVLTLSVAESVFNSLKLLLPLALLAAIVVGLLTLGTSMILTLVVAAVAALWTGGIAGILGLPVTPATLVVLPVVLGLATDYFIQSVNRVMDADGAVQSRVALASRRMLPSTGLAAVATAAGMLAFTASGIPLVRQFGLFMALGVASAYLANYLVGLPLLVLVGQTVPAILRGSRLRSAAGRRIARLGSLAPVAAMVIGAIGLIGWAALPAIKIETDPAQLVPAGDPALAQAELVRQQIGLTGEIDLVLQGPDPAAGSAASWLDAASRQIVSRSGGDLKPLESLPGFLAGFNQGTLPDATRTALILDRIPSYFSSAVYDKSHGLALAIFGLTRVTSVERDHALVSAFDRAGTPPSGYRAFPAGLSVVADRALNQLQREQLTLTALAIALILVVLLLAYRRPLPAILAILPTVTAAGAATGFLFLVETVLPQRSSPITILLAGVVVAFATEFGVLWLARYRRERADGNDPAEAAGQASTRVGPAIAASALALAAGFAVLAISGVPSVRDFGIWSAFDLLLATAAVLALLPPLARAWLR